MVTMGPDGPCRPSFSYDDRPHGRGTVQCQFILGNTAHLSDAMPRKITKHNQRFTTTFTAAKKAPVSPAIEGASVGV